MSPACASDCSSEKLQPLRPDRTPEYDAEEAALAASETGNSQIACCRLPEDRAIGPRPHPQSLRLPPCLCRHSGAAERGTRSPSCCERSWIPDRCCAGQGPKCREGHGSPSGRGIRHDDEFRLKSAILPRVLNASNINQPPRAASIWDTNRCRNSDRSDPGCRPSTCRTRWRRRRRCPTSRAC